MTSISKGAKLATFINVFRVEPPNQQRLLDLLPSSPAPTRWLSRSWRLAHELRVAAGVSPAINLDTTPRTNETWSSWMTLRN